MLTLLTTTRRVIWKAQLQQIASTMPPKRQTSSRKAVTSKKQKVNESESDLDDQVNQESVEFDTCDDNLGGKSYKCKLVSWNVNGIRAVMVKNALDYFRSEDCNILCLQELKCSKGKIPSDLEQWDRFPHKYILPSDQDGYAGVALFSKKKPQKIEYGINNEEHDKEGRVITAYFQNFIVVNAYVPNAGRGLKRLDYRIKFDEDFRDYLKQLDEEKPVILCGDLNVAHKEIDLANPKSNVKNAGFTPEERANFTTLLSEGFIDTFRMLYPDLVGCYTFWSYMRNSRAKNIGWRLDYFLVSERLSDKVCDVKHRSKVMGSDHCPIVLYLNTEH